MLFWCCDKHVFITDIVFPCHIVFVSIVQFMYWHLSVILIIKMARVNCFLNPTWIHIIHIYWTFMNYPNIQIFFLVCFPNNITIYTSLLLIVLNLRLCFIRGLTYLVLKYAIFNSLVIIFGFLKTRLSVPEHHMSKTT